MMGALWKDEELIVMVKWVKWRERKYCILRIQTTSISSWPTFLVLQI